jgi:hypothetical protein
MKQGVLAGRYRDVQYLVRATDRRRPTTTTHMCDLLWQEGAAWRADADRCGLPVQNLVEHLLHVALERHRQQSSVQKHANITRRRSVVRTGTYFTGAKARERMNTCVEGTSCSH